MFGDKLFHFSVLIGIIVLGAVIAWAMLHNRQSKREYDRTEAATRDLYKDPLDHETTEPPSR